MKILAILSKIWESKTARTILLKAIEVALERIKTYVDKDKPKEPIEPQTPNENAA